MRTERLFHMLFSVWGSIKRRSSMLKYFSCFPNRLPWLNAISSRYNQFV